MASGKQLSFQRGEVAPSQRFKSEAVSYAEAAAKVRNAYVRRDGGISNRAGFAYESKCAFQYDVTSLRKLRRIRSFYTKLDATEYEITCVKEAAGNRLYVNGVEITKIHFNGETFTPGASFIVAPEPSEIRFTQTKDGVFITPHCNITYVVTGTAIGNANIFIGKEGNDIVAFIVQRDEALNITGTTATHKFSGIAPYLPVSYLITASMKDGRELRVYDKNSEVTNPTTWGDGSALPGTVTIVHPHASLTTQIVLTFASLAQIENVKCFNLYRAAGAGGPGQSFYKLAGRINNLGSVTIVSFSDYGADEPSQTPPLDMGVFDLTALPFTSFRWATCAAYYQQRLLTALSTSNTAGLKPGEVIASKLGAPRQMAQPLITSDTGAFVFSVPIADGTPVVGMLSMERAILMTQKGCYIARGGDQGVLTPTSVNPLKISDEGCSSTVEPVSAGRFGFWLNAAHTKLMCVEFSVDGNAQVFEASVLSNHLMKKGILQLEAVGAEEAAVFAVTFDGKLVQITVADEGVFGFALHETQGFVESIFRSKSTLHLPDRAGIAQDVLAAYVIRNGVRYEERIGVREDVHRITEQFADCSWWFGTKLSLDPANTGAPGYIKLSQNHPWVDWLNTISPYGSHINIQPPVAASHSWEAGQTIKIWSNVDLIDAMNEQEFVIHFYYDDTDADGNVNTKSLRYIIDIAAGMAASGDPVVGAPWAYTQLPYEFVGYFEEDVPAALRDVRGTYTTDDYEFFTGQTRWAPALNQLLIPTASAGTVAESLYNALGDDKEISVVGEGEVLSSPLNPNQLNPISIEIDGANYKIDLGDYFSWGYVGIPYTSEIESLDIETSDNRTLTSSKKLINAIGMGVMETRGGFFGIPGKDLDQMSEVVLREDGDAGVELKNKSGYLEVPITTEWTEHGRVSIINVDPVPMTLLSIYPKGLAGD